MFMEGVRGSRNSVSKNGLFPMIFPPFFHSLWISSVFPKSVPSYLLNLKKTILYGKACTEEPWNHREDSLAWLVFLDTIQLLSFHLAGINSIKMSIHPSGCMHMQNFSPKPLTELVWSDNQGNHSISIDLSDFLTENDVIIFRGVNRYFYAIDTS